MYTHISIYLYYIYIYIYILTVAGDQKTHRKAHAPRLSWALAKLLRLAPQGGPKARSGDR